MWTLGKDSERGAIAVEYAVMVALIAVVVAATVQGVGLHVRDLFQDPQLEEALTP